jgi:hypothetical protein
MRSLARPRPGLGFWDWAWEPVRGAPEGGPGLVIDHCHRSGLVRGLLCYSCNSREGVGHSAILDAYRLRPPAVLFGHGEPVPLEKSSLHVTPHICTHL